MRRIALSMIVVLLVIVSMPVHAAGIAVSNLSFVEVSGNVLQSDYDKAIGYYSKIPLNVRENLQLAGYRVIFTDEQLETTMFKDYNFEYQVCAGIEVKEHYIKLENNSSGLKAVAHEVGHYVYEVSILRIPEVYKEWERVYEVDKNHLTKYAKVNNDEGFAEAFKMFCYQPEKLKKNAPDTYAFCQTITASVKGLN